MRGVAQQRDTAIGPLADRVAVCGGPALPALGQLNELACLGADFLEVTQYLCLAAFGHTPGFRLAAVKGDDHVVLFTAAQRVVNQMAVGTNPDAGGVPAQLL